eukprot:550255-Prymnesium_polylepis.1
MLGAIQALGQVVLQFADDQLVSIHDIHRVRRRRGPPIGRPCDLRVAHPFPGAQRQLPAGVDMAAQYEQANNVLLPGEPDWAAERDPLYGQPLRQQQRTAAVAAVWGANSDVWSDILHNSGRARFIPAYIVYLSFQ